MINSVYGKTMENLKKMINVRLVNNDTIFWNIRVAQLTLLIYKFTNLQIFDKDYAAIHEIKPVLMLNKPIYVGFTVLDLSKWKMCDFHTTLLKKFWW